MAFLRVCQTAFMVLTVVSSMEISSVEEGPNNNLKNIDFLSDSSRSCDCDENTGFADCSGGSFNATPAISCDNANLLSLDLSWNTIHVIDGGSFKTLPKLQTLSIQHSAVELVHMNAFENLNRLVKLDLSFNNITQLHMETFRRLTIIQELYFQNNPLQVLDNSIFSNLKNLKVLDLTNCQLKFLSKGTFMNVGKVNEDSSSVTTFDNEAWPTSAFINLLGNPLKCNCDMMDFHEFIKRSNFVLKYDKVTCTEPLDLQGLPLLELESADLRCNAHGILYPPRATTLAATIGEKATLPCRFINKTEYPLETTWTNDSGTPSKALSEKQNRGRYVISRSNMWINLTIENVTVSDGGSYTCKVFKKEKHITISRSVKLVVAPRVQRGFLEVTTGGGHVPRLTVGVALFILFNLLVLVFWKYRSGWTKPKTSSRETLNFMIPVPFYRPSNEIGSQRPLPKRPGSEAPFCEVCSFHFYEEINDGPLKASNPRPPTIRDNFSQRREEVVYDRDHYLLPVVTPKMNLVDNIVSC